MHVTPRALAALIAAVSAHALRARAADPVPAATSESAVVTKAADAPPTDTKPEATKASEAGAAATALEDATRAEPAPEPKPTVAAPAAIAATPAPPAPAPTPKDDAADRRRAAELARDLQTPSPGGAGRPRATITDTPDFKIALRGFAQFMAAPIVGKDALVAAGDVADFPGFRARRLQLGAEGRAGEHVTFALWLDLVDSPLLLQARLAYAFLPEIALEAGVMRVPFSRNAVQPSAELAFAERPLAVNQLVPDRQAGMSVYGVFLGGLASYRVGLFNGADPRRAGLGNDHPGSLAAGRVTLSPLGPVAASGSAESFAGPRVELAGAYLRDDAATFSGTAWEFDAAVQAWGITLSGEYLSDVRRPLAEPVLPATILADVERTGLVLQATGFVWKRDVELAARWERVDDHVGLSDFGDVDALALGAHWYAAGPDLRLNLDFYRRTETASAELANDALVLSTQGRF